LSYTGSDPHGEFESVILFKAERNGAKVSMAYKPSTVDGHYFVQGNHADSFIHHLNPYLTPDTRLPMYEVIRVPVNGINHYGFVEMIEKDYDFGNDLAEYIKYSRKAGALAAVAFFCGIDDLHVENVMTTKKGPFIIDAETAFQPTKDFNLESTILFVMAGAFAITPTEIMKKIADGKDVNGVIKYNNNWSYPDKKSFREGFEEVTNAIMKNKDVFKKWVATQLAGHPAFTRVIVQPTEKMKDIRAVYLLQEAGGKAVNCETLMKVVIWGFPYKDVAVLAMYEDNCKKLIGIGDLGEKYSIPAYYININQINMYYPDLTTEALADIKYTKVKQLDSRSRTLATAFTIDKTKKKGGAGSSAIFTVTGSAAVTYRIDNLNPANLLNGLDGYIGKGKLAYPTVTKRKRRMRKM